VLSRFGALTNFAYTFKYRGWELSCFNFFDISNSEGVLMRAEFKGHVLLRVLPGAGSIWLLDKTRFFYDFFNGRVSRLPQLLYWDLCFGVNWENILIFCSFFLSHINVFVKYGILNTVFRVSKSSVSVGSILSCYEFVGLAALEQVRKLAHSLLGSLFNGCVFFSNNYFASLGLRSRSLFSNFSGSSDTFVGLVGDVRQLPNIFFDNMRKGFINVSPDIFSEPVVRLSKSMDVLVGKGSELLLFFLCYSVFFFYAVRGRWIGADIRRGIISLLGAVFGVKSRVSDFTLIPESYNLNQLYLGLNSNHFLSSSRILNFSGFGVVSTSVFELLFEKSSAYGSEVQYSNPAQSIMLFFCKNETRVFERCCFGVVLPTLHFFESTVSGISVKGKIFLNSLVFLKFFSQTDLGGRSEDIIISVLNFIFGLASSLTSVGNYLVWSNSLIL
jgi:hypothetical protein